MCTRSLRSDNEGPQPQTRGCGPFYLLRALLAAHLDHMKDPKNAPPIPASIAPAIAPGMPSAAPPIPSPKAAPTIPPMVAIVMCSLAVIIVCSVRLRLLERRGVLCTYSWRSRRQAAPCLSEAVSPRQYGELLSRVLSRARPSSRDMALPCLVVSRTYSLS